MTRGTAASFPRDAPSPGFGDGNWVAPVREEGGSGQIPAESAGLGVPVPTLCPTGKGLELWSDCAQDAVGPAQFPLHGEVEAVGMARAAHGKGLAPPGTFQRVCGCGAGVEAGVPTTAPPPPGCAGASQGLEAGASALWVPLTTRGAGLPGRCGWPTAADPASRTVTQAGGDEKGFGTSLLSLESGTGTWVTSHKPPGQGFCAFWGKSGPMPFL